MSGTARKLDRQWSPIESAPRDGRRVCLFSSQRPGSIIRGRFKPGVGWVNSSGFRLLWRPTHWIPVEVLQPEGAAE